mmetsp:Transcript_7818/g.19857  ORF Transcript_7818/g.19857 Transcript_7818/m.19857 type:complete len:240 (-) Transcript_7818:230-949(-)
MVRCNTHLPCCCCGRCCCFGQCLCRPDLGGVCFSCQARLRLCACRSYHPCGCLSQLLGAMHLDGPESPCCCWCHYLNCICRPCRPCCNLSYHVSLQPCDNPAPQHQENRLDQSGSLLYLCHPPCRTLCHLTCRCAQVCFHAARLEHLCCLQNSCLHPCGCLSPSRWLIYPRHCGPRVDCHCLCQPFQCYHLCNFCWNCPCLSSPCPFCDQSPHSQLTGIGPPHRRARFVYARHFRCSRS